MSLEGAEKLFGLGQGQPEMFDALIVLLEGNDIGDGLFMTVTVSMTSCSLTRIEGLLRVRVADEGYTSFYQGFCDFPQHFPALIPRALLASTIVGFSINAPNNMTKPSPTLTRLSSFLLNIRWQITTVV